MHTPRACGVRVLGPRGLACRAGGGPASTMDVFSGAGTLSGAPASAQPCGSTPGNLVGPVSISTSRRADSNDRNRYYLPGNAPPRPRATGLTRPG